VPGSERSVPRETHEMSVEILFLLLHWDLLRLTNENEVDKAVSTDATNIISMCVAMFREQLNG
jgi:hypothetical protein